jgi:cytochrome c oxidase subunit 3
MFFALASIGMLFIAMTSAYVVRRGLGTDWQAIRMPQVLWFNTAVLLASSLALEKARRAFATRWIGVTLLLGAVFLGGQVAAWRGLAAQGVFLGTNPHSSFFYLLTGLHGAHVLGGLAALAWVLTSPRPRRLEAAAIYWHFMFGLWMYLLVLLFGGF